MRKSSAGAGLGTGSGMPTAARTPPEDIPGFGALTALVERMVHESGEPAGFDAAQWLYCWLKAVSNYPHFPGGSR